MTRDCAECHEPFTEKGRQGYVYCPGCRAEGLGTQRGRVTVRRTCEQCGGIFDAYEPPGTPRRRFCCNEHRLAWFAKAFGGEQSPHWRGGTHPYGPGWKAISRAVAARDGYRCRSCGRHEQTLSVRLTAAHLVPERARAWGARRELAHHPANLVALCRVCHTGFDRNPKTRFDYSIGDRPFWPEWTAQPASAVVDQATLILTLYAPDRLKPPRRTAGQERERQEEATPLF